MKKWNSVAFALIAAVLLTACGRTADTAVTTEEIVVPEMSSKDILVNSLEYLLEEPDGEQIQEEEIAAETTGQEEKEPEQEAVICYGREWGSDLTRETIQVPEITPEVLLGALARHNIVPLFDTRALSMEEKEKDGKKVLYLDLSEAFGEYVQTMSREAECIIIASVVDTFLANYDAEAVYITVEGKTFESSNAVYGEFLTDCTPMELQSFLMEGKTEAVQEQ